jgi:uncharacterized protein YegP (UPF0339 family)
MAIFRIQRDDRGEWRWSFVADNGRTMAVSAEGYAAKSGCVAAIRLLQNRGPQSPVTDRTPAEDLPDSARRALAVSR